jgi:hypothetical protein
MESLELIARIVVLLSVILFISSLVIRFLFVSKKDSVDTAIKGFTGFKFGFPIPISEFKEASDKRIVLVINTFLRISYILFIILWALVIVLVVAESVSVSS